MQIPISDRAKTVEPFLAMELMERAKQLEAAGRDIIYLCLGEPDFKTPVAILAATEQALAAGATSYTHSLGLLELRQEICRHYLDYYGVTIVPEQVMVSSGTSPLMLLLFSTILNDGDELILSDPGYACYPGFVKFSGGTPVLLRTAAKDGFQPRIDQVRPLINEKTRGLLINSPSNPAGSVLSGEEMQGLAELPIPIISDEIYDDITFDKKQTATATLSKDVPVITFNGLSKVYLVPGWRIGYTLFHHNGELDEIQDAFMRIARSRLCANSVCQRSGIKALKGPQDHIKKMNMKLKERRDFSYKRLNEIEGISTEKPDGAFYIFPKIEAMDKKIWKDDKEFVLDVLKETHVLIVNGSGFCPIYGKDHFRAVILPPIETLEKAFDNMESFMKRKLKNT